MNRQCSRNVKLNDKTVQEQNHDQRDDYTYLHKLSGLSDSNFNRQRWHDMETENSRQRQSGDSLDSRNYTNRTDNTYDRDYQV